MSAPALPLNPDGKLQTARELYLGTVIELRDPMSKTLPISITVHRASDGQTISYHVISANWGRRVTCKNVGSWKSVKEAVVGILAHEAARAETVAA
ncbi:hypothetical protein [Deinococcus ruber]|uniref:Uncharacterized protein n=1 Tax=Deinococcus ruber TaxID=1848197 RepID=A0A918CLY3_9DEIO|nr:hypothetical protein [Deinococcus ruber]GGR31181.1 hypothetical protein GCM10008957_47290 [Deinococcus ruber]